MNKVEPLMYVLYSLLIGILLYIVFRFIMGYNDHMSQVSSILIASICILYFVLFYELKAVLNDRSLIFKN
jgi:hypothetical protein